MRNEFGLIGFVRSRIRKDLVLFSLLLALNLQKHSNKTQNNRIMINVNY